jgi:hypothetical protein
MILSLPSDYFKGKEAEKITTQTTRTLIRNGQFRGYSTISQQFWNPNGHYRVHKSPPPVPRSI